MRVKAFVIHLERAVGRRPQVERLRRSLPIATDTLPAVDGQTLSAVEISDVYRQDCHRPRYPFLLSRSEIACFLSHRRAWQTIVDQRLDAALIVEDDAAITSPHFLDVLQTSLDGLGPDEVVRFPHRPRHEPGAIVRAMGDACVIEPRLPALGMVMQVVGREAAGRLLDASRVFDRPVDAFVQLRWLHSARILTARPVVISEICGELGGTVIHTNRGNLFDKMMREVQRPLMRIAVHRENEHWLRKAA